jgi:hypothetical protein
MANLWNAGALCCSSDACVLLDKSAGSDSEDWELIPHVTYVGTTETVNSPKLVTSSTGGRETSACGTVVQSGTLTLACHLGVGPAILGINRTYRIRWSPLCDSIWDSDDEIPVADPDEETYFEALIRITTVPLLYDISGNAATTFAYTFDVISFINYPPVQTAELVTTLF